MTLLDIVIFLPLAAFLIVLFFPKNAAEGIRRFSLVASTVIFLLSLGLIGPYWFSNPGRWAFENNVPWISSPAIRYHVAIDGISLWLVLLSTLLTPICVLVSWRYIQKRVKEFFAFLLLLEFGLVGVFCALDFFLFYVFWEVALVPMYFLIGVWGHERRIYAAIKFFLYTMAGSVLMLASVMLKMGTYGLLRYCVPMFPNAARTCAGWIATLAIIGIIYGALVAMVQPNMKKLVAYSSVSHLGFVVLGIFSFTQQGFDGAVYQMLNHGVSTGALFILVGFLYERRHSLEIAAYGGVATPAPKLSAVFMITMLASIGLPMLNNFVGEYLVLQGTALVNFRWSVFAAIGVILSACYMLWLYQRVFFGRASDDVSHHMQDLDLREYAIMLPLIVLMVWMGTFTQSFIPSISASNSVILGPVDARRDVHVDLGQLPISQVRIPKKQPRPGAKLVTVPEERADAR